VVSVGELDTVGDCVGFGLIEGAKDELGLVIGRKD